MQPPNALEVTTLENMNLTNQVTPHPDESTLDQIQNYSPVMITQPTKFSMKGPPLVLNDANEGGKVQTQLLNSY